MHLACVQANVSGESSARTLTAEVARKAEQHLESVEIYTPKRLVYSVQCSILVGMHVSLCGLSSDTAGIGRSLSE